MTSISDFESAGIFLEATPEVGVRFQVWPSEINDSKTSKWVDIEVPGRSEPIKTYYSSTARKFAFTLLFVASVDQSDNGNAAEVKRKVDFCQSIIYPVTTSSGFVVAPPVLYLVIGDYIRSRVVATSCDVSTKGPWLYDQKVKARQLENSSNVEFQAASSAYPSLPLMAEIHMSFEEVNQVSHDYAFVKEGRRATTGNNTPSIFKFS